MRKGTTSTCKVPEGSALGEDEVMVSSPREKHGLPRERVQSSGLESAFSGWMSELRRLRPRSGAGSHQSGKVHPDQYHMVPSGWPTLTSPEYHIREHWDGQKETKTGRKVVQEREIARV